MTEQETLERDGLLEDIIDALQDGVLDEVEDLCDEAIELYPNEGFGYFYMGETLYLQGQPSAALNFYQQAAERSPSNPSFLARLALILSKLNIDDKAVELYERVLALEPNHLDALVSLGVLNLNADDYVTALDYLNQSIELSDKHYECFKVRALIYQRTGQRDKALSDLDKALELNKEDRSLWLQKINLLDAEEETAKAKQTFATWVALDQNDADRNMAFGIFLMSKEDWAEAEEQFSFAIERELYGPYASKEALLNRGKVRLKLNKISDAQLDFKQAIGLDNTVVDAYLGMAETYQKQELAEGEEMYLKIGANAVVEDTWLIYQKQVEFYLRNKNYTAAKDAATAMTAVDDDNVQSEGYFYLGNIAKEEGLLAEAYRAWKQSDELWHEFAMEHIEMYCQAELAQDLKDKEEGLLEEMSADFAANATSPILGPLAQKIWMVDVTKTAKENPMFAEMPKEMEAHLMPLLKQITVALSSSGLFVLNPGQNGVRMVYAIANEDANAVTVKGIPLGGSDEQTFTLKPVGTHVIFSGFGDKEADLDLYLKEVTFGALSKATQKEVQQFKEKGALDFMGKPFNSLIEA